MDAVSLQEVAMFNNNSAITKLETIKNGNLVACDSKVILFVILFEIQFLIKTVIRFISCLISSA